MSRAGKEDFQDRALENIFISLISNKIHVLVIGGGRAGYIKAKSFSERGANVTVLSPDFNSAFHNLSGSHLQFIQSQYKPEYLMGKHLVVIAVSDKGLINGIISDCEAQSKLYLCCNQSKDGLYIVPAACETEQSIFAFHTKSGSPATAVYIRDKIHKQLLEYDEFIEYACRLRNSLRGNDKMSEIMNFVNTEDFVMFYNRNKHKLILKLFYGGIDFED